jgi:hypothetical protein
MITGHRRVYRFGQGAIKTTYQPVPAGWLYNGKEIELENIERQLASSMVIYGPMPTDKTFDDVWTFG